MNNFIIVTCAICLSANLAVRHYHVQGQNVDDASNFGLVSIQQSGTANASGVTQQMSQVYHMPVDGPIVPDQLVWNYKGYLMGIKGEVRNG